MPYNTEFYGENGYRLTTMSTANVDIRCANFNGNGNEVAGQLKSAVLADKFAVGEDLDGSIQTHGIPPYGDWNTLNDYGGFGYLGAYGEQLIHDIAPTPSAPILWCFHRRSNITYQHGYCVRKVKLDDVLWGADKTLGENNNTNIDATSLVPIVQMDYKNFFVVPYVLCSNMTYDATEDEYGRYSADNNQFSSCYAISLETYLNNYWNTYPVVHGIFYTTYLCRWISQDPMTINPLPVFNYSSSMLANGITPIVNKKFGFSTDTNGGLTDGTIVATGSDFCSPWLPANGVTLNFTRTDGIADTLTPSSGNFMYVLGCNTNTSGDRQARYTEDPYYTYDGVTPAYGASHIKMIKSNIAASTYPTPRTRPVWFDKPTNKADFKEAIHKMMSWLAIPWADEVGGVETGETPIYIGTLDNNGIATGEYVTVTNPEEVPQMASDDFINDNHYDPGYDPTKDIDDPYEFPSVMRTGFGKFERAYLLNDHYVEELHDWFNDCTKYALHPPTGVDPDEILKEYKNCAYGESPIDGVVSLMVFPTISMEWLLPTGSGLNYLHIGTLMTNQVMGADVPDAAKPEGYKIGESSGLVPFTGTASSILWQPYYNDFRDYAPYTSAELVIPYHGSVQLDPADWLGRLITIKYVVDIRTGVSTALVCREGIPILSVDGQVGIPVPVHATDAANMINSQVQNAFQMKSAELQKTAAITDMVFGTAQAATTGAAGIQKVGADLNATQGQIGAAIGGAMIGTMGALAKGINGVRSANLTLEKAKQEMSHIPVTRMSVGSASSSVSAGLERYPRLNIHRPKMAPGYSAEVYGHTVGFACNMYGEVGRFTGYTECGDVDCSGIVGATEEEKNMIHDALVSGTYL